MNLISELDKLATWFNLNRLSLNLSKTNYILFGNKRISVPAHLSLDIDGTLILEVDNTKFLGIYIDSKLSWNLHVNTIATKIAKSLGIINKARMILSKPSLL